MNYQKYKSLITKGTEKKISINDALNNAEIKPDSIKRLVEKELNESIIPLTEKQKNNILKDIEEQAKDPTKRKKISGNKISFGGSSRIDKFVSYQKKNPKIKTDDALDSLKYEKNFKNRFFYQRAKVINKIMEDTDSYDKFVSESISYGSISLFILLPLFTLFLKLFYIRRKYTYVDHLIFVFHTQTVFFMLVTLLLLISFFISLKSTWIFLIIFLIYLFLAMKKFYNQGFFKTFIKFLMLNLVYFIMGVIGVIFVMVISFAIY
ncbi:MAG: hypothetical protein V3V28_08150 [Polaribacter sp.]|uniref:hypothetical protein n=1 Tax=Polaribacter sp. TaxID=1920175 RepID=UPI002F351E3F